MIREMKLPFMATGGLIFMINTLTQAQLDQIGQLIDPAFAAYERGGKPAFREYLEHLATQFSAPPDVIDLIMVYMPEDTENAAETSGHTA